MPELPEVQTVVDYLQTELPDKRINSVYSPNGYHKVFENGTLEKYQNFLDNKQIQYIWRRGKYIVIDLDSGHLLFHLRMTGKLMMELKDQKAINYVSFKLQFTDGSTLFFIDTRKFGRAYICQNLNWLENHLGVEPLSNELTPLWLYKKLKKRKKIIKHLLLDQSFIVGLGNIYIDEILWQAKIHPETIASRLSRKKVEHLQSAIKNILQLAIQYKGTTISDFFYGQNKRGNFQKILKVFGRTDQLCYRCKSPITKIFVGQRGTHYCNKCQNI